VPTNETSHVCYAQEAAGTMRGGRGSPGGSETEEISELSWWRRRESPRLPIVWTGMIAESVEVRRLTQGELFITFQAELD